MATQSKQTPGKTMPNCVQPDFKRFSIAAQLEGLALIEIQAKDVIY
jgi:hypothetical protein